MSIRLFGSVAALVLVTSLQFGSARAAPVTTAVGLTGHDGATLVHSIRHRGHGYQHHQDHGRHGHHHHHRR